jgi:mono/diheme cytochrome c family protein
LLTNFAKGRKNRSLWLAVPALWALTDITGEWRLSIMIRPIRNLLVFCFCTALVSILSFAGAQEKQTKKAQVKPTNPVSGAQMFKEYCAVCHGPGGKGGLTAPAASALKVPPPDLTTLAQRHDGKFPDDYVANVLRNGVKTPAHGSAEMPVWGPLFETMTHKDEAQVTLRITNLTNYLKSIQKK